MKMANESQKSDLDALSHAMGFKTSNYLLAKPKAKAGDVAARPPRKVGADFMGGMTALLYAAREGHMETVKALVEGAKRMPTSIRSAAEISSARWSLRSPTVI